MPLETDAPQQNHVRHQALKAWPRTVRIGFTSKQRKAILRVSAGKRFSGMQRFRSDRFATAAQIIVRLFSFCWFRNRTTKSVRGIMNSDPGNQDVQPRTLPAFFGVGLRQRSGTAVYLASRASDFVTGTTIRVDGGYAIR